MCMPSPCPVFGCPCLSTALSVMSVLFDAVESDARWQSALNVQHRVAVSSGGQLWQRTVGVAIMHARGLCAWHIFASRSFEMACLMWSWPEMGIASQCSSNEGQMERK
jgi:hypothetical protein